MTKARGITTKRYVALVGLSEQAGPIIIRKGDIFEAEPDDPWVVAQLANGYIEETDAPGGALKKCPKCAEKKQRAVVVEGQEPPEKTEED